MLDHVFLTVADTQRAIAFYAHWITTGGRAHQGTRI